MILGDRVEFTGYGNLKEPESSFSKVMWSGLFKFLKRRIKKSLNIKRERGLFLIPKRVGIVEAFHLAF